MGKKSNFGITPPSVKDTVPKTVKHSSNKSKKSDCLDIEAQIRKQNELHKNIECQNHA